ncbi:MAG: hypothetical protein AAB486_04695 [Patescibacteria group bacterium]
MKKKTRRALLLALLLIFIFGVAGVFAMPKIKRFLSSEKSVGKTGKSAVWTTPAEVLGALTESDILPDVITRSLISTESASPNLLGGAMDGLSEQVQKAVKDAAGSIADSVKQAVLSNVSINQDKIAQDITAKLLQSLLDNAGKTSTTVDRGVYDACTNIVKNPPPSPSPPP